MKLFDEQEEARRAFAAILRPGVTREDLAAVAASSANPDAAAISQIEAAEQIFNCRLSPEQIRLAAASQRMICDALDRLAATRERSAS